MDIERFLNVRNAYGASFGPAGEQVAFLLDATGVPQVWTLDSPGEWPELRTFFDERVTFVDVSPADPVAVFGMDEGGNEREQFYRLGLSDGAIEPLTARPAAKHRWGGFDPDGDRFAFAANRRDESVFDIYVQPIDGSAEDAALVHEGEGWVSVASWGPRGDRLAVHRAHSNYDHDVYLLDLDGGEWRHLTPNEDEVRYTAVEWGPAGEALYLTTDRGTDTRYLGRLELETLDLEVVVEGGDWNVDGVTVHRESGRIAFTRNVDGYAHLSVGRLDGTAVEPFPDPALPHGVYGGVDFTPTGDRFAVTVTGRTTNPNVFVVDVASGDAERWTRASLAGIPPETFVEPDVVRFPSVDAREIPGLLSLPDGDTSATAPPYPVIVDIHGGPESQRRPSFSPVTGYFLHHGYAVFEPNVRGSTGYGKAYTRLDDKRQRMDAVADLARGVEWLAGREEIDADRVVALGASYGGFMVLAALTEYPDLWAAGVDIVGIANFVTFLENTGSWRRSLREAEYGSLAEDREFLESISPVTNVGGIEAPLLVLHGANDPRVPVGEAEQIAEEASEHVPTELLVFEDEGHGFSKLENRIEAYTRIVEFLNEHV